MRTSVDHGSSCVVRYFGRAGGRRGGNQVFHNLRSRSRHAAADGRILQSLVSVHTILRLLNSNGVLHAILWIQPESWGRLEAGTERNKNVLRHVARLHAHGLGAGPVAFHVKRWIIKCLLNVNIHSTRKMTELVGEVFADRKICMVVYPGY